VEIGVSLSREVVVDNQVDSLNIDTSAEKIGGHQQSGSVGLEEVIVLDSFFLFELRVNADRVEEFLSEKFCKFLGSVDSVDEDDHLVEGQSVEQVSKFFKFLVFVDVDIELGQSVENELSFIDEDFCFLLQKLFAI